MNLQIKSLLQLKIKVNYEVKLTQIRTFQRTYGTEFLRDTLHKSCQMTPSTFTSVYRDKNIMTLLELTL